MFNSVVCHKFLFYRNSRLWMTPREKICHLLAEDIKIFTAIVYLFWRVVYVLPVPEVLGNVARDEMMFRHKWEEPSSA